jgi:hypothetical protein
MMASCRDPDPEETPDPSAEQAKGERNLTTAHVETILEIYRSS